MLVLLTGYWSDLILFLGKKGEGNEKKNVVGICNSYINFLYKEANIHHVPSV